MKENPVKRDALVTPIDQAHPWFGQALIVTRETDDDVFARIHGSSGRDRRFRRIDLAAIASPHGSDMARAIGKQRFRTQTKR